MFSGKTGNNRPAAVTVTAVTQTTITAENNGNKNKNSHNNDYNSNGNKSINIVSTAQFISNNNHNKASTIEVS